MKTAILRHDICLVQISDKTREGSETLQSDDSVAAIFFYSIILINYNYFIFFLTFFFRNLTALSDCDILKIKM